MKGVMKHVVYVLVLILCWGLQGSGWRTGLLTTPRLSSNTRLASAPPSDLPTSTQEAYKQQWLRKLVVFSSYSAIPLLALTGQAQAADSSMDFLTENNDTPTRLFIDSVSNRYSLFIPSEWNVIERLPLPKINFSKFQLEQVLVSGTCFTEGTSFSVTQTDARQLLKDLQVDYWFAPINTMIDVGTANLIASILISQREGSFDLRRLIGTLRQASFIDLQHPSQTYLEFDYTTPFAEEVLRKTIAKTYLKDGQLYTIWISGLTSAFDSDYGQKLEAMKQSFRIL